MSVNSIIFSPQDRARISQVDIQRRREAFEKGGLGRGVPLYMAHDDEKKVIDLENPDDVGFMPAQRGEMITVVARPGHGKTAFKMRWARERAADIRKQAAIGADDAARRVVV